MALIIKGDMPKGCGWDCDLWSEGLCAPLQKSVDEHTIDSDCPIIGEIPDSHGDLIDEDEFRLVIYREIRNHKKDEPITMILKGILWEMDNAPVIVEANNE